MRAVMQGFMWIILITACYSTPIASEKSEDPIKDLEILAERFYNYASSKVDSETVESARLFFQGGLGGFGGFGGGIFGLGLGLLALPLLAPALIAGAPLFLGLAAGTLFTGLIGGGLPFGGGIFGGGIPIAGGLQLGNVPTSPVIGAGVPIINPPIIGQPGVPGPTGPAGPSGPKGAPGPPGPIVLPCRPRLKKQDYLKRIEGEGKHSGAENWDDYYYVDCLYSFDKFKPGPVRPWTKPGGHDSWPVTPSHPSYYSSISPESSPFNPFLAPWLPFIPNINEVIGGERKKVQKNKDKTKVVSHNYFVYKPENKRKKIHYDSSEEYESYGDSYGDSYEESHESESGPHFPGPFKPWAHHANSKPWDHDSVQSKSNVPEEDQAEDKSTVDDQAKDPLPEEDQAEDKLPAKSQSAEKSTTDDTTDEKRTET